MVMVKARVRLEHIELSVAQKHIRPTYRKLGIALRYARIHYVAYFIRVNEAIDNHALCQFKIAYAMGI